MKTYHFRHYMTYRVIAVDAPNIKDARRQLIEHVGIIDAKDWPLYFTEALADNRL